MNDRATGVYGGIVVDVTAATVQVVLTSAATSLVVEGGAPYGLWMDPTLPDQEALVTGMLYANVAAAP